MSESPRTGLTVVLGPANSGKMGRALEWWRQRLSRRPVVVAPTGPDARELSMEMARRTGGLVDQSPALVFDSLVSLLLGRSSRYATDLEQTVIASRLLRDTSLEALGKAARLPGVATALTVLLRQLGESGKSLEELDRVLARWASVDEDAVALSGDIRRLVAGHAQACADLGLTDRPAAVRESIAAAGGWTRPVALYGFTSFTPGQRMLVEELSRHAEVLVVFSYDRSRAANLSTPEEISRWVARASEVVDMAPISRAYSSPAVAYLERNFMSDEPPAAVPPASSELEGVRFLLASGRRAEAELAVQQVSDLIRAGFQPGSIAVVVRHMRSWSTLLGRVFQSCGIPYQMDERSVLGETGLGHAFIGALGAVVLDDAGGLLGYLRSPYGGLASEEVCDLELRYRRGTARGARAIADLATSMGLGSVESLWRVVAHPGSGPLLIDSMAAQDLARNMLVSGLRGAVACRREMEEDARAFRALQAALDTLAGLAGAGASAGAAVDGGHGTPGAGLDPATDASGLMDAHLVLHSLPQVDVPGGRFEDTEAVQILSVRRARARRFDVVVVLGLVEGEFPGRADSPSLLTAAQRTRLDAVGEGLFMPEADEEAALFVSAVSRAWQLVFLSARDAEDDGGDAVPSHFWEEANKLLGADDQQCRTLADQVFVPASAPSLRDYLRACAARGRHCRPAGRNAELLVAARHWSRPPSRLTDSAVLKELEATTCFSPSALESYLDCPFRWFVERVIGIEDADFELDGRMVGQMLHSALSATYRKLASACLLPLRPEGVAMAESTAFAIIDGLVDGGECPGSYSERRLAAWRLKRMVRNLLEMEVSAAGELVLSETETWVGGRNGVDIDGLRIRGRIDRVDATPEGTQLLVLDYKSGAIPPASGIGKEGGLQLPLYLLALAAERPGVQVVGGVYLALFDKKRSGVVAAGREGLLGAGDEGYQVLDDTGVEELFRTTRELAQKAATGMRSGVIAPRPERQCPSWCRLGPACRSRRGVYRP